MERGGERQAGVGQGEAENVPGKEEEASAAFWREETKGLMGQRAMDMQKKKKKQASLLK